MKTLILCEGSSDAILLGYYLQRVASWKHKKAPSGFDIKAGKNESAEWYARNDDWLMIGGVGGNSCFGSFFEKRIKKPQIYQNAFEKIAIVCDRDNNTTDEIIQSLLSDFGGFIHELSDREWKNTTYQDGFEIEQVLPVLLLTIPVEKEGALETLLMDAIGERPEDKAIVERCQSFVDEMVPVASQYLTSRRLQLKSKLSVIWAIQSPQKVFKFIDEQLQSVEWERSEILRSCFEELTKI